MDTSQIDEFNPTLAERLSAPNPVVRISGDQYDVIELAGEPGQPSDYRLELEYDGLVWEYHLSAQAISNATQLGATTFRVTAEEPPHDEVELVLEVPLFAARP